VRTVLLPSPTKAEDYNNGYDSTEDQDSVSYSDESSDEDEYPNDGSDSNILTSGRLSNSPGEITDGRTPSRKAIKKSGTPTGGATSATKAPASASGNARGPPWNALKDVPRLMAIIIALMGEFLTRDQKLNRRQRDAKDMKPFWTTAAIMFNDRKYKINLLSDPNGHDFTSFSTEYSGHVADSNELETKRFNVLRKELDKAMPMFKRSGNGDGGPIEEEDQVYKFSSKFWSFCNGNCTSATSR
jgi:hypothetical protein